MPKTHKPRSGSLQYWPRKRAKRAYARVRSWPASTEAKPLGFAGYKVGMTHIVFTDNRSNSMTKGKDISMPVTIIECPALKTASIIFYKNTPYGLKIVSSIPSTKLNKELKRKMPIPKSAKIKLENIKPEDYDDMRILVYTQPRLTTIGKKKPELFELALGGKKEEKLAWLKENLAKEIKVQDILKPGQLLDAHGVTKGMGLQGPVKRQGIGLRSHKSEKSRRKAVLAAEGDAKVQYTAHQSGQTGYHLRIQHNLWLIKIGEKPEEINNKCGFKRYGIVKNPCLVVKGSIQGPAKRLVLFTSPLRPNKKIPTEGPAVQYVSK